MKQFKSGPYTVTLTEDDKWIIDPPSKKVSDLLKIVEEDAQLYYSPADGDPRSYLFRIAVDAMGSNSVIDTDPPAIERPGRVY